MGLGTWFRFEDLEGELEPFLICGVLNQRTAKKVPAEFGAMSLNFQCVIGRYLLVGGTSFCLLLLA